MIPCRSRKSRVVTKPNPPLLRNGSKRFTKLKPGLKHNGEPQKEEAEENGQQGQDERGGEDGIEKNNKRNKEIVKFRHIP